MMTPHEMQELSQAITTMAAKLLRTDEILDVKGAAELLGVSQPTIERRTMDGSLPSFRVGRLRRYRKSDLLRDDLLGVSATEKAKERFNEELKRLEGGQDV